MKRPSPIVWIALLLIATAALTPRAWKALRPEMSPDDSAVAKMQEVVEAAIRKAKTSEQKETLRKGEVFVNLQGLDIEIVGVAVPLRGGENRAMLTFTRDVFDSGNLDHLAEQLLDDLALATQHQRDGR